MNAHPHVNVATPDACRKDISFLLTIDRFCLLSAMARQERDFIETETLQSMKYADEAQCRDLSLVSEAGACRCALQSFLETLPEEELRALVTLITAVCEDAASPMEHWVQVRALYCSRASSQQFLLDKGAAAELLRSAISSIGNYTLVASLPAQIRAVDDILLGVARSNS